MRSGGDLKNKFSQKTTKPCKNDAIRAYNRVMIFYAEFLSKGKIGDKEREEYGKENRDNER